MDRGFDHSVVEETRAFEHRGRTHYSHRWGSGKIKFSSLTHEEVKAKEASGEKRAWWYEVVSVGQFGSHVDTLEMNEAEAIEMVWG